MLDRLVRRVTAVSAFAAMALLGSAQSQAETYGFRAITNNSVADAAIGEAQLFVDVTDGGNGRVSFLFMNLGPAASSIADIYFDDGALLGSDMQLFPLTSGVDFSQFADPKKLPSGNTVNFNTSAGLSADSNPPAQPNGVNPGEKLEITFGLKEDVLFSDILEAMALSLANPGVDMTDGLRIGIHVQGFADGQSESFVNSDPPDWAPPVVPLPSAAWGGMVLMAGIGVWRLRQARRYGN